MNQTNYVFTDTLYHSGDSSDIIVTLDGYHTLILGLPHLRHS